ncbi:MAG: hypothetical protein XD95_0597, partial [Microgenomates bacterium 39_7]
MQENLPESHQEKEQTLAPSKNNRKLLYIGAMILVIVTILAYALLGDQVNQQITEDTPISDGLSQLLEPSDDQQPMTDVTALEDGVVEQSDLPPIDDVAQATQDSRLIISAEKQTYQVGEQINMTLLLTTAAVPDGIQFIINY